MQHGGGNQPFFEAYEYDYRNALSAVHFGTWDPNSGLPSIGLPSTVTNGSLASLGGAVEQRTRGAEVADLMRIEGDDIYGAYGAQQEFWLSYDSAGNDEARDPGHRIASLTLGGKTADLDYSCDGQITGITYNEYDPQTQTYVDHGLRFEYDDFGRLLAVTDANYNDIERYYYGPMGRLAAYHQADAGVYYDADLQRFVYHGDHMVAAYLPSDHNGNAWTDAQWEAIWGPSQNQLLTFFDHTHATGTRVLNVMRDHRNSVVGAYDADTDHVVGRAHYNADGRMMTFDTDAAAYATSDIQSVDCQEVGTFDGICEAPGGIPFAFNSMWRSPATGMVYMRNRVYDPRLGQFLSHDPLGYVDSHNLYQYGLFDPINYWDPYGLFGWKEANQAWNAVNDVASDVVGAKDQIAENMGAVYMESTASALDSVGITDGAAREFFDTTRSAAAAGIEGVAKTGGGLLVAPAEVVVAMDDSSEDMKDGMQQASNAETAEDYAEATGKFSKGVLKGAAIGGLGGKGAKRTKGPKTRTKTPDSKRAPKGKTSNEASDATTTKQSQNDKTQNSANGSGKQKPGGCFAAGTPVVVAGELLPIEQVEVGQRVSQYNDGVCDDLHDPDPETCVVVELELDEPTHASKRLRATLMRDAAWLKANANNGRIWLGFDEINAEGWSRIESVSSCPVIEPGEGCLVTGTFTHLNDDVMALRFEELEETVHVTSLHPLYSLDRDQWLNVRDIKLGERLASKVEGWLTVSSSEPLHETMQVFNIEVQGDHEYLVFDEGLRSHNVCDEVIAERIRNANGITDKSARFYQGEKAVNDVFSHLEKYTGISRHKLSERLHKFKNSDGFGGADNVVLDRTGNVYNPNTGELMGSLTAGGK